MTELLNSPNVNLRQYNKSGSDNVADNTRTLLALRVDSISSLFSEPKWCASSNIIRSQEVPS